MKVLDALNEQANFELESAYIYLGMSGYLADQDMNGMKHFMDLQAKEELEHAGKMIHFLQDVGYSVKYRALNPGEANYTSLLDVFEQAYAHEQKVTENINKLVDLAREQDDKRVQSLLKWYVDEQVEEESNFATIITQLQRAGENWGALYQVDAAMGRRG